MVMTLLSEDGCMRSSNKCQVHVLYSSETITSLNMVVTLLSEDDCMRSSNKCQVHVLYSSETIASGHRDMWLVFGSSSFSKTVAWGHREIG